MIKSYLNEEYISLVPINSVSITPKFLNELHLLINNSEIKTLFRSFKIKGNLTVESTLNYIAYALRSWEYGKNNVYFLLTEDEEVIGSIDLQREGEAIATIGFWSSPQRPGFMTNALKIFLKDVAFKKYNTITAYTRVSNLSAVRILERLDFIKSGVVEGKDLLKYSKDL